MSDQGQNTTNDVLNKIRNVQCCDPSIDSLLTEFFDEIRRLRSTHDRLRVAALAIMDEKGRSNPEGNSVMLWKHDWDELRSIIHGR